MILYTENNILDAKFYICKQGGGAGGGCWLVVLFPAKILSLGNYQVSKRTMSKSLVSMAVCYIHCPANQPAPPNSRWG